MLDRYYHFMWDCPLHEYLVSMYRFRYQDQVAYVYSFDFDSWFGILTSTFVL